MSFCLMLKWFGFYPQGIANPFIQGGDLIKFVGKLIVTEVQSILEKDEIRDIQS